MGAFQSFMKTNSTVSISSNDNKVVDGADLLAAAYEGRADDAVRILEKDPTLLLVRDLVGDTAIHVAVRFGHGVTVSKMIKLFIDNHLQRLLSKALVEGNGQGDTPLHLAIKKGLEETANEIYMAATQAALVMNDEEVSPFKLALQAGYEELVSNMKKERPASFAGVDMRMTLERCGLFDDEENDCIELHTAAWKGQEDVVQQLLDEDINLINCQDKWGRNVVHVAAAMNHVNVLMQIAKVVGISEFEELILERDHDLGQTALHLAIERGHQEAAVYLIEMQPRAAYKHDKNGVSPIFIAVDTGFPEVVRKMVALADKDSLLEEARKTTLAHVAVKRNNIETLQALMDRLQDLIISANSKGWTPLSYAANRGHLNQVCYFIKHFPDSVKRYDADGYLPIHKAIAGGNINVVKELLSCCPYTLNDNGHNILSVAKRYGSKDVFYYLKNEKHIHGF